MKKGILTLLITSMVALFIFGCDKKSESDSTNSQPTVQEATKTAQPASLSTQVDNHIDNIKQQASDTYSDYKQSASKEYDKQKTELTDKYNQYKSDVQNKYDSSKQQLTDTYDSYTSDAADQYEIQMTKIKEQIAELQKKATTAQGDLKIKYDEQIKNFKIQYDKLKQKLAAELQK